MRVAEFFQKFQFYTRTEIAAGEHIYLYYSNESVLDVFIYYGFVEQAPRTWDLNISGVEDGISVFYPMRFMVDDDEFLTWIETAPQLPGPIRELFI